MLDINGVEINVGDEVYVALGNCQLVRIKIVKETDKTIHYLWQVKESTSWNKLQKGDWYSNKSYMFKSSQSFKNMLKC